MKVPSQKQFVGSYFALEKERAGKSPNTRESRDLTICENFFRGRLTRPVVERFPAKLLRDAWGYSTRQGPQEYRAFAQNHGLPCSGQTIDLLELLRRFHEICSSAFPPTQGRRPTGQPIGFSEFVGPIKASSTAASEGNQVADDSVANWKSRRERLRYEEETRRLIDVDSLRPKLERVGGILRSGCVTIRSQFGPEAEKIMIRSIEDCERALMSLFDDDGDQEGET